VMPYNLFTWRLGTPGNPDQIGCDRTSTIVDARAILDECQKHNLTVSPSLHSVHWGAIPPDDAQSHATLYGLNGLDNVIGAVVEGLKNHPALLSWYVADEIMPGKSKFRISKDSVVEMDNKTFLSSLSRTVRKHDPWHPQWAVLIGGTLPNTDYSSFANLLDTMGVDHYCIGSPASNNMMGLGTFCSMYRDAFGTKGGVGFWAVPQLQNMGSYDWSLKSRTEYLARYRDPTEKEMLSMALMFAIHGAKGFYFYSYSDLRRGLPAPDFEKRWKDAKKAARMLKSLEPYLLGDNDGPACVASFRKGSGAAGGFEDNTGKVCVLVSAGDVGGEQEATIRVAKNPRLKSRFGRTARNGDGSYTFKDKDVTCDILE
jgi:hypothetical protein